MKNAKATVKGWVNQKTGELLKAQKMTQEKADELNGVVKPAPVVEAPKPKRARKPKDKPVVEEAPVEEVEVQQQDDADFEPQEAPKTSFFNRFTN